MASFLSGRVGKLAGVDLKIAGGLRHVLSHGRMHAKAGMPAPQDGGAGVETRNMRQQAWHA